MALAWRPINNKERPNEFFYNLSLGCFSHFMLIPFQRIQRDLQRMSFELKQSCKQSDQIWMARYGAITSVFMINASS
jgi:hypothetical protein